MTMLKKLTQFPCQRKRKLLLCLARKEEISQEKLLLTYFFWDNMQVCMSFYGYIFLMYARWCCIVSAAIFIFYKVEHPCKNVLAFFTPPPPP